jgi:hypothetical protein
VNRFSLLAAAGLAAVAMIVVVAVDSSAQTPGARTLTFFERTGGRSLFKYIDVKPKSSNRASLGDRQVFDDPILDQKGGKRRGSLFVEETVVRGGRFSHVVTLFHGAYRLGDGQIAIEGSHPFAKHRFSGAVVGGTGAYEGAHGTVTVEVIKHGAHDTLNLLP